MALLGEGSSAHASDLEQGWLSTYTDHCLKITPQTLKPNRTGVKVQLSYYTFCVTLDTHLNSEPPALILEDRIPSIPKSCWGTANTWHPEAKARLLFPCPFPLTICLRGLSVTPYFLGSKQRCLSFAECILKARLWARSLISHLILT